MHPWLLSLKLLFSLITKLSWDKINLETDAHLHCYGEWILDSKRKHLPWIRCGFSLNQRFMNGKLGLRRGFSFTGWTQQDVLGCCGIYSWKGLKCFSFGFHDNKLLSKPESKFWVYRSCKKVSSKFNCCHPSSYHTANRALNRAEPKQASWPWTLTTVSWTSFLDK